MKQETLEEAAERYYEDNIDESNIPREHYEWEIQDLMIGFAYQWQQEQDKNKYSEEDMINFAQWFSDYEIPKSELISFTEQFKNK
jgi:hypothetical protein